MHETTNRKALAELELTPIGETTQAVHRTTMTPIEAGAATRCPHRFSTEAVAPTQGVEDPDVPIIGQWVNPDKKLSDDIEVEFTEIEEDGGTIIGRDCIRYTAGQAFLTDLGKGARKLLGKVSADGRKVTTKRSLAEGKTRTDTHTVEDDGTMTRRWVVRKGGKIVFRDKASNHRGVPEDGCLARTTRPQR